MVDFLKANTFATMEDYKWNLNPRMIKIMCADNTHVRYLSEKQASLENAIEYSDDTAKQFSDLGIPIFNIKEK